MKFTYCEVSNDSIVFI